jgi:hypothetical protein
MRVDMGRLIASIIWILLVVSCGGGQDSGSNGHCYLRCAMYLIEGDVYAANAAAKEVEQFWPPEGYITEAFEAYAPPGMEIFIEYVDKAEYHLVEEGLSCAIQINHGKHFVALRFNQGYQTYDLNEMSGWKDFNLYGDGVQSYLYCTTTSGNHG